MAYRPKLVPPPVKKLPVTPADLVKKAIEGDVAAFEEFLDQYHELMNKRDDNGNVALHVAASKGNHGLCALLVRKGANIDIQDIFGNTPLLYAIDKEEFEIAKMFVQRGANVQLCDFRGNSPLHSACSTNHLPMVEFLLQNGADPEALDFSHKHPKDRTSNYQCKLALEREIQNRLDGGESTTQKLVNYMGFGIGLGVGLGMALAKQQEMYAQQLRDEEARKAADAEAKRLEMNARLKRKKESAKPKERKLL
jgi:hypothetical protein